MAFFRRMRRFSQPHQAEVTQGALARQWMHLLNNHKMPKKYFPDICAASKLPSSPNLNNTILHKATMPAMTATQCSTHSMITASCYSSQRYLKSVTFPEQFASTTQALRLNLQSKTVVNPKLLHAKAAGGRKYKTLTDKLQCSLPLKGTLWLRSRLRRATPKRKKKYLSENTSTLPW